MLVKLTQGLFHFFLSLYLPHSCSLSLSFSFTLFLTLFISLTPSPSLSRSLFFSLSLASFRFHFCPIFLSFMSVLSFTPFPIRSNHFLISIYFHLFIHSILHLSLSPAKFVILSFLILQIAISLWVSWSLSRYIHSFFFLWHSLVSFIILFDLFLLSIDCLITMLLMPCWSSSWGQMFLRS